MSMILTVEDELSRVHTQMMILKYINMGFTKLEGHRLDQFL